MEDMRKAALVIGCGDTNLRARIASNRSEGGGGGVESVEGGYRSDGQASRLRPGDYGTAKTDPATTRPSRQ